jgi:hypothetical protein
VSNRFEDMCEVLLRFPILLRLNTKPMRFSICTRNGMSSYGEADNDDKKSEGKDEYELHTRDD